MNNSVSNVQITATAAEFKNGNGFVVEVKGMNNKIDCKRNFTDPLKALRYMFMLQNRLDLKINRVDLAAVSLTYQRAKDKLAKAEAEVEKVATDTDKAIKDINKELDKKEVKQLEFKDDCKSMIEKYNDFKKKHPDALLLIRCGDFYETYEQDAVDASQVLGITLTRRIDDGVRMAGFPYHALDTYLPKIKRAGKRVAICDE